MGTIETIAGYKVIAELGRGAGSTIYAVEDPADGSRYALKRVVKQRPEDQRFIDQVVTELECSKAVPHPAFRRCHLIKKVRFLLKVREVSLVMELVEGRTLAERRPATLAGLAKVFYGVGEALTALNKAGHVHADIKPSNILVERTGRVRIIDLGQSCLIGTVKERIQGTPDYIAPEQVKRRPLTAQTDMFNFGASLYWCVTGRPVPTMIPKADEQGNKVSEERKFPRPSKLNPLVPPTLDRLIGDCVRTSPSNRPESWQTVLERLKIIYLQLTPRTTLGPPPGGFDPEPDRWKSESGQMCAV